MRLIYRAGTTMALAACLLFPETALSDTPADGAAECVENLQIPRHGPPGKPGDAIGPVVARIVPDESGRVKSITTEGGTERAALLVKSWVSESTFLPRCAGRTVTFKFSFRIEGPPIEYPFSWVTFQSPNHFIIYSRSRKPDTFRVPGK